MIRGEPSRTAEAAAAVRASHYHHASPTIFADQFAIDLTSPGWRFVVRHRTLNWLITRVLLRSLMPISALVLVRSRYAEEKLEAAVHRGVDQYVIVGAGFDSFLLRRRDLATSLHVFELDHPTTQQAKVRRLARLGVTIPTNVEFVPIDFEGEELSIALTRTHYQSQRPAFFSWLGTTHYLSKAATLSTLKSLVGCSAPGSELVFDYSLPSAALPLRDARTMRRLEQFTRRRGELLIGHFEPEELSSELRLLGYAVLEDLSATEQRDRYFMGRSDGLAPTPAGHLVHVSVLRRLTSA